MVDPDAPTRYEREDEEGRLVQGFIDGTDNDLESYVVEQVLPALRQEMADGGPGFWRTLTGEGIVCQAARERVNGYDHETWTLIRALRRERERI